MSSPKVKAKKYQEKSGIKKINKDVVVYNGTVFNVPKYFDENEPLNSKTFIEMIIKYSGDNEELIFSNTDNGWEVKDISGKVLFNHTDMGGGTGSIVWGSITGNINNQTDLITTINTAKEDAINSANEYTNQKVLAEQDRAEGVESNLSDEILAESNRAKAVEEDLQIQLNNAYDKWIYSGLLATGVFDMTEVNIDDLTSVNPTAILNEGDGVLDTNKTFGLVVAVNPTTATVITFLSASANTGGNNQIAKSTATFSTDVGIEGTIDGTTLTFITGDTIKAGLFIVDSQNSFGYVSSSVVIGNSVKVVPIIKQGGEIGGITNVVNTDNLLNITTNGSVKTVNIDAGLTGSYVFHSENDGAQTTRVPLHTTFRPSNTIKWDWVGADIEGTPSLVLDPSTNNAITVSSAGVLVNKTLFNTNGNSCGEFETALFIDDEPKVNVKLTLSQNDKQINMINGNLGIGTLLAVDVVYDNNTYWIAGIITNIDTAGNTVDIHIMSTTYPQDITPTPFLEVETDVNNLFTFDQNKVAISNARAEHIIGSTEITYKFDLWLGGNFNAGDIILNLNPIFNVSNSELYAIGMPNVTNRFVDESGNPTTFNLQLPYSDDGSDNSYILTTTAIQGGANTVGTVYLKVCGSINR